jgi:beta-glucosidase
VDIYLERPSFLADIEGATAFLIANFGSAEESFVKVLLGELELLGRRLFEIPASMATVEASLPDVACDTEDPTYPFGFGRATDEPSRSTRTTRGRRRRHGQPHLYPKSW